MLVLRDTISMVGMQICTGLNENSPVWLGWLRISLTWLYSSQESLMQTFR